MRIRIEAPWRYKGDIYEFTSEFVEWLEAELEKHVVESEDFTETHGMGWTLFFRWDSGRRLKKPRLAGPWIDRKYKEKRWLIELPWLRYTSFDPNAYVPMLRQVVQHLAAILTRELLDASKLRQEAESLLSRFAAQPRMIEYDPHPYTFGTHEKPYGREQKPVAAVQPEKKPQPRAALPRRNLPKWTIPKQIEKRVEEDGMWESERFDPVLLTIMAATSHCGRSIPLAWQIEFEPGDERLQAANEKLRAAGIEPDGDGWSRAIQARFNKRFPKLASELHDDSDSATCVLWVESESACKGLVKLLWSMLFKS